MRPKMQQTSAIKLMPIFIYGVNLYQGLPPVLGKNEFAINTRPRRDVANDGLGYGLTHRKNLKIPNYFTTQQQWQLEGQLLEKIQEHVSNNCQETSFKFVAAVEYMQSIAFKGLVQRLLAGYTQESIIIKFGG